MIYNKHGNLVRIFYLLIALFFYAASFGGYLKRKRSIVLCYHGILAGQKRLFRWQIERVATQNRPTFWWKKSPTVSITFDDAFDNLIENAIPALIEFNVSALIFAISKNLGNTPQWKISKNHPEYQERTMTATKLNIISKNPLIRIGSHTLTHPFLTEISHEKIREELLESKRQLENLIKLSIDDLALPHGSYNQLVIEIAQETGYKRIYTLDPNTHDINSDNKIIGRFLMTPDVWQIEFVLTCAGAYSWLLPWRRFLDKVKRLKNR